MTKDTLNQAVDTRKAETREALLTVYNALNQGQQKKLLKDEKVRALFEFYEVTTS